MGALINDNQAGPARRHFVYPFQFRNKTDLRRVGQRESKRQTILCTIPWVALDRTYELKGSTLIARSNEQKSDYKVDAAGSNAR